MESPNVLVFPRSHLVFPRSHQLFHWSHQLCSLKSATGAVICFKYKTEPCVVGTQILWEMVKVRQWSNRTADPTSADISLLITLANSQWVHKGVTKDCRVSPPQPRTDLRIRTFSGNTCEMNLLSIEGVVENDDSKHPDRAYKWILDC